MESQKTEGDLVKYLPAAYQEDAATCDFLLAFEKILLGRADAADVNTQPGTNKDQPGLERLVSSLATYFDPPNPDLPKEFLPWLSQWVALSLRLDVSDEIRGKLIAQMPQLYRDRGTKTGMENLLTILTNHEAHVKVQSDDPPHFFTVLLNLNALRTNDNEQADSYTLAEERAHSVIRAEKPAHTRYRLVPKIATMRIGKQNTTAYWIRLGKPDRPWRDSARLGVADWE